MIPKPLKDIDEADLRNLVHNEIAEGKTIDYKRDMLGETREAKSEFLSDIVSFANTAGGDLLFGVVEVAGVATEIVGVDVADADALGLRFENMCRDNIEPRIPPLQIRVIALASGAAVVIVRVSQSWQAPHRNRQTSAFFARNSRGKYPMDVAEIRSAFLNANSLEEKIRSFRDERVRLICADQGARPLPEGVKIVLHLLPIESISGNRRINLNGRKEIFEKFRPMDEQWNGHFSLNINGVVNYPSTEHSYTQFFRSGCIEAVLAYPIYEDRKILWGDFERAVSQAAFCYITELRKIDIVSPVALLLSICNVKGSYLQAHSRLGYGAQPIGLDNILVPDFFIENDDALDSSLKEIFEIVWNAYGYSRPENYMPGKM